jgi:hypothetical protein
LCCSSDLVSSSRLKVLPASHFSSITLPAAHQAAATGVGGRGVGGGGVREL